MEGEKKQYFRISKKGMGKNRWMKVAKFRLGKRVREGIYWGRRRTDYVGCAEEKRRYLY